MGIKYNLLNNDKKIKLKNFFIDTGMGLERITAIIQNTKNNYKTDIFRDIIEECEVKIGCKNDDNTKSSLQIIADHIRTSSFLISENIQPSNENQGYILRKIIRRALFHIN